MPGRKGRKRYLTDIEGLAAKVTVKAWLRGLSEGGGRTGALYALGRHLRWRKAKGLESDPDVLIESCLNGTVRTLVEHEKALLEYFEDPSNTNGDKRSTVTRYYRAIRGFYAGNLVALPRAKLRLKQNGQDNKEVEVRVTATDYLGYVGRVLSDGRLTVRDRAVVLTMLQTGMDASTLANVFNVVAYPQLVKHFGSEDPQAWDSAKCPVRIDLIRPKSDYRYYSFLDVDAVDALKSWLQVRRNRFGPMSTKDAGPRALPSSYPIFVKWDKVSITPENVTRIFTEAGKRAGVNDAGGAKVERARYRYPFHSHEVRDTLITLHKRTGADIVAANFFTGHDIDKLQYDKSPWDLPEYYREQYMRLARPWLNPLSGSVLQVENDFEEEKRSWLSELQELKRQVARLAGLTPRDSPGAQGP